MKVNGRPRSFGPARFSLTMTLKALRGHHFVAFKLYVLVVLLFYLTEGGGLPYEKGKDARWKF